MYETLANWYGQIWPPDPRRMRDRWLAVENLVETLNVEAALDYAALAFGCDVSPQTKQIIRDAAARFDPAYVPAKDEHELSLLASAVIVHGLNHKSAISDVLALALTCVQFGRSASTPIQRDLTAICGKYLSERMVSAREDESATPIQAIGVPKAQPSPEGKKSKETNEKQEELRTEHFETLLLATCRFSKLLDSPFRALRKSEAVFLAAYELAALTRFAPGLSTYSAVLDTLLRDSTGRESVFSIGDTVKAIPRQIEKGIRNCVRTVPCVFPCQFGIALWDETNDEDQWQRGFLRATSLNPQARYPLLQLAKQSYLEQILCSTWASLQVTDCKTRAVAANVVSSSYANGADTPISGPG